MMLEAKTAIEIYHIVENLSPSTIIFLDVDDTLIVPQSKSFSRSPNLIDEIKDEKADYPNFSEILSNWRLQRKIILLDENWPNIVEKLKSKFKLYALTKMDTGSFGNIKSMEDWRYAELKSLGLEFHNDIEQEISKDSIFPSFYKGIFFTGKVSKGQTLSHFQHRLDPQQIVMVDDRIEYLEDIKLFCDKESIKFIGIVFKGLENLGYEPDSEISAFQKAYLIKHAKWLEDDEAKKLQFQDNL